MLSPPLLLALLVAGIIAVLFSKQRGAIRSKAEQNVLPMAGRETGNFDSYLARIEALARTGGEGFFVTLAEEDGPRFIQVSAGRAANGTLGYQFDIPVTDWSARYVEQIKAEADKRGLSPYTVDGGAMTFLDIEFATSGDHAIFARWVVRELFGLAQSARFEITWG